MLDELRFFLKNFFQKYHGCDIKREHHDVFLEEANSLVEQIAHFPQAFSHRDFHCRNLILFEGKIFLLDFQDAFLGPYPYDLVSLLLDPYAELPEESVGRLQEHYFERQTYQPDRALFRREFCYVGIQRLLKALGTYAYLTAEKNLSFYEPFISLALRQLSPLLEELDEFVGIHRLLVRFIGDEE